MKRIDGQYRVLRSTPWRSRLLAAAAVGGAVLAATVAFAGIAAAQTPPSTLKSIDVYRTTQLDAAAVKARYAGSIRELVAAIAADDGETAEVHVQEIVESIRASGDFARVDLGITMSFGPDENAVYLSIEIVDAADAAARLSFNPEPTRSIGDPGGVLAAWDEYQRTVFDLMQTRQIEPTIEFADCPAHHCIVAFDHEALAPFLDRFDRAARAHRGELVRVLREDADAQKRANAAFVLAHVEDARQLVQDLVPSLDDPAGGVRNNVMRVLWMAAHRDATVEIPVEPLGRRLDDAESACRNKAALLLAVLAERPEYRSRILALAPAVLRLLRLEKPNNHEPAYAILTALSGETFGERDYDRWEEWIRERVSAAAAMTPRAERP